MEHWESWLKPDASSLVFDMSQGVTIFIEAGRTRLSLY